MDNATIMYIALGALAALVLARRLMARKASPTLVRDKLRQGAKIIDVRSPQEFASSAYPKAKNIPIDELSARMGDLRKDVPLVLYCASGARSAKGVRLLRRAGFADVISAGGLADMPK